MSVLSQEIWNELPTVFKVLIVGRFVVYIVIAYVALHFIQKLW